MIASRLIAGNATDKPRLGANPAKTARRSSGLGRRLSSGARQRYRLALTWMHAGWDGLRGGFVRDKPQAPRSSDDAYFGLIVLRVRTSTCAHAVTSAGVVISIGDSCSGRDDRAALAALHDTLRGFRGDCMGTANVRGFTLLELMVTLAVAVVLLTIAIPSYRSVVTRNSLATNVNDLVGSLNYARSEAVGRGTTVYVCASRNQSSCRDDGVWSDGWIVYAPAPDATDTSPATDNILRVHGATGSGFTLTANGGAPLSFNADGFAIVGRTFTATTENGGNTTSVTVASTGRIDSSTTP
ncbi:GspH/FimT family pseudopilin [Salinisphaera hydrothermalis]|nr:GspH/FimT family pseudopilin [Salinisphaera hydrothermalis]